MRTSASIALSALLAAGSFALAGGLDDVKKKDTLTVLTQAGYLPFVMKDK